MWYQVKVKYDKMQDNGCVKPITDVYVVDALSFTEAEARITEHVQPYISGEFQVTDIKRANYAEVWEAPADADYWFESQLEFITINEAAGTEKRTKQRMLVQADNLQGAMGAVGENMRGTMADFDAVSIKATPIVEVVKYNPENNNEDD